MESLIIHGHFYQPPRENPWTDAIDDQPGAAPFENWNERIYAECYRANAFARISDTYGRVEQIVNNYAHLSFNFGPTLLTWVQRYHPHTYEKILAADRASVVAHQGHGNAMAQAYHHAILPLCNERDRRTEILWGLADFRIRFGREAESMWLPETACDPPTLGALIDHGLRYVILSPYQAGRVRPSKTAAWRDVTDGSIDTSQPYAFFHPDGSGRSLAIFFYHGALARGIAFEGALASSQGLVDRFVAAGNGGVVNVATDGESYGHHYHFGDRALAYALEVEAARRGLTVTNYGAYLATHPPTSEVELKAGPNGEGTAWSCAHGLGRWTRNCGCQAGGREGWDQKWRTPLRAALEFLRDHAATVFESMGADIFRDPWDARDHYVELRTDFNTSGEIFFERHGVAPVSTGNMTRGLALLEMQRASLMMFTSCGWFFNDISGIETVQILLYAGRLLERLEEFGLPSARAEFLDLLAEAKSNLPSEGTGAAIFEKSVAAAKVLPDQVAAQIALTGLAGRRELEGVTGAYDFSIEHSRVERRGRITVGTGEFALAERATGRRFAYAVGALHFGDVDFYCAVRPFRDEAEFQRGVERVWSDFANASLPHLLRSVQEEFGPAEFGLEHLLSDGRRSISEMVFGRMVERFSQAYERLYDDNRRNLELLQKAGFTLPKELLAAAEFTAARRFETAFRTYFESGELSAWKQAWSIGDEVARNGYHIRRTVIWRMYEEAITKAAWEAARDPSADKIKTAIELTELAKRLDLELNLDRAQEALYYAMVDSIPDPRELRELALMVNVSPEVVGKQTAKIIGSEPT
jgi:hypothetical protein